MESSKKTLVGTIGYHILGNHSIGPVLLPRLQKMDWPTQVQVDELNWGPLAVVQQMEAEKPPFQRVVLLGAIERPGRAIGDITVYQWQGGLPDATQIQACVGDAATGVISVENLLVIGEYFKVWKDEVFLLDIEPGTEIAGEEITPAVQQKIPEILETIYELATLGSAKTKKIEYLFGDKIFADG